MIALVAVPLLLLGAGCRGDADSGGTPQQPGGPGGSVQRQFDDIESTLNSIESEMRGD